MRHDRNYLYFKSEFYKPALCFLGRRMAVTVTTKLRSPVTQGFHFQYAPPVPGLKVSERALAQTLTRHTACAFPSAGRSFSQGHSYPRGTSDPHPDFITPSESLTCHQAPGEEHNCTFVIIDHLGAGHCAFIFNTGVLLCQWDLASKTSNSNHPLSASPSSLFCTGTSAMSHKRGHHPH
ncbi:hypothetical protein SCHPADRAFT_653620 [Schizopora paradoxa]|uniref:Uncharacterized protein n=1 Tax=Schizopora paradoxa TaxID=27342 RepID=A0A0H2R7J2_9AGAM|nr:hypothetical protein SCHPADRAFT_653620 [Schizopora paradoxa]